MQSDIVPKIRNPQYPTQKCRKRISSYAFNPFNPKPRCSTPTRKFWNKCAKLIALKSDKPDCYE